MAGMYLSREMGNAPSARFYGSTVGTSIIVPPRDVRVSPRWNERQYSSGVTVRRRPKVQPDRPTGQGAETRARATGQDVPLSPREMSLARAERAAEQRRRMGNMNDLD